MTENQNNPLLSVHDLRTYFLTDDGVVRAVDGVSFEIHAGETFAIVGESGCGKSVTSFSILKLLPYPPAKHVSGRIALHGQPLLDIVDGSDTGLSERQMRDIRGSQIGMIFQEPMTSLNPVFTCGSQIVESVRLHRRVSAKEAKALAIDMLDRVGIDEPEVRFGDYPHQMSGGMRQRVMIAIALCCQPELLIADEPTTALDVTIQAQILQLLAKLQRESGLGILLITHDLAVVAESAHRVAVMYAAHLVETAATDELFAHPLHPYTKGLLASAPRLGERKSTLNTIPGSVPNPLHLPSGCAFHPRCPIGCNKPRCQSETPPLVEISPNHHVACWEVDLGKSDLGEKDSGEKGILGFSGLGDER
jgi:oligopeptide/dipeptide ABC transporter ATP-binding protein